MNSDEVTSLWRLSGLIYDNQDWQWLDKNLIRRDVISDKQIPPIRYPRVVILYIAEPSYLQVLGWTISCRCLHLCAMPNAVWCQSTSKSRAISSHRWQICHVWWVLFYKLDSHSRSFELTCERKFSYFLSGFRSLRTLVFITCNFFYNQSQHRPVMWTTITAYFPSKPLPGYCCIWAVSS